MKSLSLSQPHIIAMVGVPGAGKTFFAEHFSETFKAPFVNWGTIRSELFNEPTYSSDEDAIIERVAAYMLSESLKTGATVLYEGDVATQTARRKLQQRAKKAGYDVLFVWTQIDQPTAKQRAGKQGIDKVLFDKLEKRFSPLKDTEPSVVISGKHTYASQLKIVLRRLSSETERAPVAVPEARKPQRTPGRRVTVL